MYQQGNNNGLPCECERMGLWWAVMMSLCRTMHCSENGYETRGVASRCNETLRSLIERHTAARGIDMKEANATIMPLRVMCRTRDYGDGSRILVE